MTKEKMGRIYTIERRKHLSAVMKKRVVAGVHNFWKGGVSLINRTERENSMKMLDYKLWREEIFKRDDYTCQWCKQQGGKLQADHIKIWSHHPELRFDVENGKTLCVLCHKWKTKMDMKIFIGKVPELIYA